MSPGSRSGGCTAFKASILRRYDESISAAAVAVASFARTLPLKYRSAVSQPPPSGLRYTRLPAPGPAKPMRRQGKKMTPEIFSS